MRLDHYFYFEKVIIYIKRKKKVTVKLQRFTGIRINKNVLPRPEVRMCATADYYLLQKPVMYFGFFFYLKTLPNFSLFTYRPSSNLHNTLLHIHNTPNEHEKN